MTPIRIDLSGCDTASCDGLTVKHAGGALMRLCRKLIAEGYEASRPVQVFRGSTPCFEPASLGRWGEFSTAEGAASVRIVKHVPFGDMS